MAVAVMCGQAFVMVMATPPPPLPTSTSDVTDEKSKRSNSTRVVDTVLALMLRRNLSNSAWEELEKSSFACGIPLRIESAVLKDALQREAMAACLLPT